MNKKIVLTGGGTTGHVSVNLALIPRLKKDGWEIHYFGSKDGIERELISNLSGVKYHCISTGKFRRRKTVKSIFENFKDVFKVMAGSIQSIYKIFKIKPNICFSKGGFVSVPVIFGAWVNRVPTLAHESDFTPGLANKLVQPFVKTIFTTFRETNDYIKEDKATYVGPVIREDLKNGDKNKAIKDLELKSDKPVLLIMGGSQGSAYINQTIRDNLSHILEKYTVIHSTGKGNLDSDINMDGYYQYEYMTSNLKDILALSDLVISRSGANAIFEFLYYKIPMILIPLVKGSRGDQVVNARSFEKDGFAVIVNEDEQTKEDLLEAIDMMYKNLDKYKSKMESFEFKDGLDFIYSKINKYAKKSW